MLNLRQYMEGNPLMNLIRLSFAFLPLIAAAAVFTIALGDEQAAKSDMQLC
jgi:hypothetical protein